MKKGLKLTAVLLALCLLSTAALAYSVGDARTVIGADLNSNQVAKVYQSFGIERGSVPELTVTNSEERTCLEGIASDSVIGTRSISCVYIEIAEPGTGIAVSLNNINWCTADMFRNALTTAGIENARVFVSAPFAVSGTAALTGIYKAYEDLTGEKLSPEAKAAGTEELVITAELADEISSYDAVVIVNELKLLLDQTKSMTDEELLTEINALAKEYNVSISDEQKARLINLCRSLEGLSTDELKSKVEAIQNGIKKIAEAKETAENVASSVKTIFSAVGEFFTNTFGKLKSLFGK